MRAMVYLRPDLKSLLIKGPDARAFLGGLISQRTDLPAGAGSYGALLTPQGKVVADFPLFCVDAQQIALALPAPVFAAVKSRLTMFKLKSQVTLEDGPPVRSAWGAGTLAYGDPRHHALCHGFGAEDGLDGAANLDAFHNTRANHGVPEGQYDLELGKSTLLDEGLACAIDWDKGCYMGQEVTARMRYRALLKRVLVPFQGTCPDQAIMVEGKKIGDIRSRYADTGFAYVRKEYAGREVAGLRLGRPIGLEQFANLYEPD